MATKRSKSRATKRPTVRRPPVPGGSDRSGKRALSTTDGESGRVRTILYVHGIGNKPSPEILKCQWDEALFGFNLGERSRMAYWVNRVLYPQPTKASCKMADATQDLASASADAVAIRALAHADAGIEPLLPADTAKKSERDILRRIAERVLEEPVLGDQIGAADFHARVLPLPAPLREFITRRITKAFLKDVNEFLFVKERRDAMRESVLSRLRTGGGPFIVIAHSQGSMVAYDALSSLTSADGIEIDLLITIGSPLGLEEVQDQLKVITNQKKGLGVPGVVKRWVNVADPLDPVCADKRLRGDYSPTGGVSVEDFEQWNADSPRDPHSGSGYLRLPEVRGPVRSTIDRELFQRIAPFTIARDLVSQMEAGAAEERHAVLIELRDQFEPGSASRPADDVREDVVGWIRKALRDTRPRLSEDDVDLEPLASYVSAKLTRTEIERMSTELHLDSVYRVFRNARKRALLDQSINVLQCATAHRGYDSRGQGITWAVLDTGIDPLHPHFSYGTAGSNIGRVFDCLSPGAIREWDAKNAPRVGVDGNGHGTHVSGIIAGRIAELGISGIAPAVTLHSYKVLNDEGRGSDAKIIKALDHIYDSNRSGASLVIHGVNLSLGGAFDPEAFGCGDTPICKQLRKLWRQGVVVVLAAGNEGYLELQQGDETIGLNTDLSIGDPANLDEALAVGSIHKSKPHLYGVSYFSSRGPTADGRCKPDLVAPGERIVSCRAGANPKTMTRANLYVAMSGTSMAAPHVSGVVACFLSARREFIGYPERIREILLGACTDLKRDRMHQGAGMPNLVKMLLGS
ncbi:S8 family peptidase [Povalibacter sp.]|uniref:S8 family peptidase n=1 Tax=Povalibacter sp. TaxID=1962978 RepID=UPI002F418161